MSNATSHPSHLHYIDALRAIAFLSVLTVHAGGDSSFAAHGLTSAGQYGVQLFFLLSAITLLRSLHSRVRNEARPTLYFYIRRIFRIGPLFWLGAAVYFFINDRGPQFFAPDGVHAWQYLLTLIFAHGWAPSSINSVVPGGWSIAVEMNFYLILPLIWRRIQSITQAGKWLLISLVGNTLLTHLVVHILSKHYSPSHLHILLVFVTYWFPAQISTFLLGFILFYVVNNQSILQALQSKNRAFILGASGAYLLITLALTSSPSAILFSLAWGVVIVSCAAKPPRFLVHPALRYLGKISFSCYITHFAMLRVAEGLFSRLGLERLSHPAFFVCLWLSVLLLTGLVSTITYRLIEKPGIRLGDALIGKLEASARRKMTGNHLNDATAR